MIKFLIDVLQISVILWLATKTVKFFFGKNRYSKNKKSIVGKLGVLVSRRVHFHLDSMIKAQKVKFSQINEQIADTRENNVPTKDQDSPNVSYLQKYKTNKSKLNDAQTN